MAAVERGAAPEAVSSAGGKSHWWPKRGGTSIWRDPYCGEGVGAVPVLAAPRGKSRCISGAGAGGAGRARAAAGMYKGRAQGVMAKL